VLAYAEMQIPPAGIVLFQITRAFEIQSRWSAARPISRRRLQGLGDRST
jgi:hypothetical protein